MGCFRDTIVNILHNGDDDDDDDDDDNDNNNKLQTLNPDQSRPPAHLQNPRKRSLRRKKHLFLHASKQHAWHYAPQPPSPHYAPQPAVHIMHLNPQSTLCT